MTPVTNLVEYREQQAQLKRIAERVLAMHSGIDRAERNLEHLENIEKLNKFYGFEVEE